MTEKEALNQEVTLKLTVAEINQVLNVLGAAPYLQVKGLVEKVFEQGRTQYEALGVVVEEAPAESKE